MYKKNHKDDFLNLASKNSSDLDTGISKLSKPTITFLIILI